MLYFIQLILFFFLTVPANKALAESGRFRYLCDEGGQRYFTLQPPNSECSMHFLEESWNNLTFSEDHIVDYNPYDVVQEENKVKIWSRLYYADSTLLWNGVSPYNHMRILSEFSCGKRQIYTPRVLAFWDDKFVGETSFVREDIEPETINDMLYKRACESSNAAASQTGVFDELIPEKSVKHTSSNGIRKIRDEETIILDSERDHKAGYAIWLLAIFQILFIYINWWGYKAYYMQPFDHPRIFWNPVSRWLVLTLPWVGIIVLAVSSFFFTPHPAMFLLFTGGMWLFLGYRSYKSTLLKNPDI